MAQESRATGTLPEAHSAALVETQVLNAAMEEFWKKQLEIIKNTEYNMDMFRTNLPLARIKKIMKSDDDVRHLMISNEVPALLAKACELFIQDLSTRAWLFTDANHRRTLQRTDIVAAVARNEMFDFLIDILPSDDGSADAAQDAPDSNDDNGAAEVADEDDDEDDEQSNKRRKI